MNDETNFNPDFDFESNAGFTPGPNASNQVPVLRRWPRELEVQFSIADHGRTLIVAYWSNCSRDKVDVCITPHDDGAYLQFSALLSRIADVSPALPASLELLNRQNAGFRMAKFFRQPDGSVRATGDLPLADAELTAGLFRYALDGFSSVVLHTAALLREASDRAFAECSIEPINDSIERHDDDLAA